MTTRCLSAVATLLLFGCGGAETAAGPAPGSPSFDGQQAFVSVQTQVAFGPRVPGTAGHARQLVWMLARLDSLAPEVAAWACSDFGFRPLPQSIRYEATPSSNCD